MERNLTQEQKSVLENDKKNMLVSASAGTGKTFIMINLVCDLICEKKMPVSQICVLTFTKAAAAQMKDRLLLQLKKRGNSDFIVEQIDQLSTANISTIHSFCERYLRKYAHFLDLNENFSVLDESQARKIKEIAFEKTLKFFEKSEDILPILSAFRNNHKKIKDVIFEIENLTDALAEKEEFVLQNIQQSESLFDKACDFVFQTTKDMLCWCLKKVESLHVDDFHAQLCLALDGCMQSANLFQLSAEIQKFSFPKLPMKKQVGEDVVKILAVVKKKTVAEFDNISALSLSDQESVDAQRQGRLEKALLGFFEEYQKQQSLLKKTQNVLSFADLERKMLVLSKRKDLFENIKYFFVDEYQDTNKIQEKIIKNLSENNNFVAVGDVKQGIYGFRLASAEIFLNDSEKFLSDENSTVKYLTTNFRSNQKILDFVNEVFCACMTKDLTGVDYASTSMLVSIDQDLQKDQNKAVFIDLCQAVENEPPQLPEIYSVKDAEIFKDNKNQNLLLDIKRRILQVVGSTIFDGESWRKCNFGDIAILSRNTKYAIFQELERFLQESEIPVVSSFRSKLLDQPEMEMLKNFLHLALSFDDDVALVSVLMGGMFCFSCDEVLSIKKENLTYCESILQCSDQKTHKFLQYFNDFRLDFQVFGIRKALENIFQKTQYRAYINFNKPNLAVFVEKFLEVCEQHNFDLPELVNFLETVDVEVVSEISTTENAVTLTTIHASKGLEFPVVFLIGCDQNIFQTHPKADVEINEKFGLAVKTFDEQANKETISVRMRAIKKHQEQKSFAEELMIFYVALTRAKNLLFMFAEDKEYEKSDLSECDCYMDFVFHALPDAKEKLKTSDIFEKENLQICRFEKVEEEATFVTKNAKNPQNLSKIQEKIEKYLDFSYRFSESANFRLKETVTNLSRKNDNILEKYDGENFVFSQNDAVEVGNAYHAALKCLDFQEICDLPSLERQMQNHSDLFDATKIDKNLLLKNILLLKNLVLDGKVYKEKEFVMKEKICNLVQSEVEDEILVQGVVDLFVEKKDEIILVDFKFSSSNNDKYLIEKYKGQLSLYKIALQHAFKKPVKKVFLLSLKNCKLLPVNV